MLLRATTPALWVIRRDRGIGVEDSLDQLRDKSILVTGGTGSFGQAFVRTVLTEAKPRKVIVYSRDELKQFHMQQAFADIDGGRLRYFIGDVREVDRLRRAFEDVDIVIHAAALKQVPAAEYNPIEFVRTNVLGAENVVNAALDTGVSRVVALSTDKAAAPINLYGATKLCSDKLFVSANNVKGTRDLRLTVVRYGNVMGSRGSVIPFFLGERPKGVVPITDERMTRFNILLCEGVDLVMRALKDGWGGEIFVPKIPSYLITTLATAIAPECEQRIVGIRPGEKIHEEMITESDALSTVDLGNHYAILPQAAAWSREDYLKKTGGTMVAPDFSYSSGTNPEVLSVEDIRRLVREHLDPDFVA